MLAFKTPESKTQRQHWIHDSEESGRGRDQLEHKGRVGQEEAVSRTNAKLQTLDGEAGDQVTTSTVT